MFPITFNAVGDIVALVDIALFVVSGLTNSTRAGSNVKTLSALFTSLGNLLRYAMEVIATSSSQTAKELANAHVQTAYDCIEQSVRKLAKFELSHEQTSQAGGLRLRYRANHAWACLKWSFLDRRDVEGCHSKVSQSFGPLIYALLLTLESDRKVQMAAIQGVMTVLRDATVWNGDSDALRTLLCGIDRSLESLTVSSTNVQETIRVAVDETRVVLHGIETKLVNMAQGIELVQNVQQDLFTRSARQSVVNSKSTVVRYQDIPTDQLVAVLYARLPPIGQVLSRNAMLALSTIGVSYYQLSVPLAAGVVISMMFANQLFSMMFKQPRTIHTIFVMDLNDFRFEMPFEEVSTSEVFHKAVQEYIGCHTGLTWVKAKQYILTRSNYSADDCGQLPIFWDTSILHPGDYVRMDCLVYGLSQFCPGCGAYANLNPMIANNINGWIKCIKCPIHFKQLSDIDSNSSMFSTQLQIDLILHVQDIKMDPKYMFQRFHIISGRTAMELEIILSKKLKFEISYFLDKAEHWTSDH